MLAGCYIYSKTHKCRKLPDFCRCPRSFDGCRITSRRDVRYSHRRRNQTITTSEILLKARHSVYLLVRSVRWQAELIAIFVHRNSKRLKQEARERRNKWVILLSCLVLSATAEYSDISTPSQKSRDGENLAPHGTERSPRKMVNFSSFLQSAQPRFCAWNNKFIGKENSTNDHMPFLTIKVSCLSYA